MTLLRGYARLIAHLAAQHPSVRASNHPHDERWVVYIQTPAGQLSWPVEDDDLPLFRHVPAVSGDDPRARWDGHSVAEKYQRLDQLTAAHHAERFDLSGLHVETYADFLETSAALYDDHPDQATYRYVLERRWSSRPGEPLAVWLGLNPSTATARHDDPTIRRIRTFTERMECGGFAVLNLYALRATDPARLTTHPNPVGNPATNQVLHAYLRRHTGPVIAAWGTHPAAAAQADTVLNWLAAGNIAVQCLGRTATGAPKHPLYLPSATPLQEYQPAGQYTAPRGEIR
jgi:hypothetical protein